MHRVIAFVSMVIAPAVLAQTPGATVSGIVRDTLVRAPLSAASVQLVSMDAQTRVARTTMSDATGRYQLTDVPDGRYRIGFFHPVLDSIGIEPMLREIVVANRRAVRADLSTPTAAQLRASVCPSSVPGDSAGFVMGVVRDSRRAPLGDATITAEWLEYQLGIDGIDFQMMTARTTPLVNGSFVLCHLPQGGTLGLRAMRGVDTTDRIEVELGTGGFLRRDLYVGAARTVAVADTVEFGDSVSIIPRLRRSGDGRLSGRVVSAFGNQPLGGVQVTVLDGPQTRTNDAGEWSISGAPLGTRVVEFRAVGLYPERTFVDVVEQSRPLETVLRTLQAMLDTVRITAVGVRNRQYNEFLRRQRSGVGTYMSLAEIERRKPMVISDLFKIMPGVMMRYPSQGPPVIQVRTPLGWCQPTYFIDGLRMGMLTVDVMDGMESADQLAGIEVYTAATVPAQFRDFGACGVVLLWTKMDGSSRKPWTKRNTIGIVGLGSLSVIVGLWFMSR